MLELTQKIILIYGKPGCGKSYSLSTLPKLFNSGTVKRLVYVVTEKNALDGFIRGIKANKINLNPNEFLYVMARNSAKTNLATEISALKTFVNQTRSETQQTVKTSTGNKSKYTYLLDLMTGFQKLTAIDYVTKDQIELGNIYDLNETDVLIIDGLTPIVYGIWSVIQGDRKINDRSDYQVVQKQLETTLDLIINATYAHIIILGHADEIRNENAELVLRRPWMNAGNKLSDILEGKFTDVIYAHRQGLDYRWSGKMAKTTTVCRNYPEEANLIPDFSKYDFFK